MLGLRMCLPAVLVSIAVCAPASGQPAGPLAPPGRDRPDGPERPQPYLTRVASEATESGIEVAIFAPAEARYPEGAPVVVSVAPALSAGVLDRADRSGASVFGFVAISFAYPPDAFDMGGPLCRRAIADVILFALGRRSDIAGRLMDRLCPVKTCPNLVGAIGTSHGGNALLTALQSYPDELGDLAYYVSYESPCGTSPQRLGDSILVDSGGVRDDPDPSQDADGNGFPWDDATNPYRTATGEPDLSKLAWDAQATRGPGGRSREPGILFLDGNGNGTYDTVPAKPAPPAAGGQARSPFTADLNGNGRLDADEDFALQSLSADAGDGLKRYYSLGVATAAEQCGLAAGLPDSVARAAETRAFWEQRDMAGGFDRLSEAQADMPAIVVSGRVDHVQAAADYPHIRAQYEGLRRGGLRWVKINPDPAYVHAFLGPTEAVFPANAPNCDVFPETMWQLTAPTQQSITMLLAMVSAVELADRVHAGDLAAHLEAPLVPVNLPWPLRPPADQFATRELVTR